MLEIRIVPAFNADHIWSYCVYYKASLGWEIPWSGARLELTHFLSLCLPLGQDVLHKGLAAQSGHIFFIIFFCLLHHAPCSDCISFLSSALFMIFWDLLTTSLFSAVTKTSDQSSSCIEAAVITWTQRGGGNITVWVLWSELLSRCLICPSLVVLLGFQVPRREWRGPFCWAKMHIHTETDR